MYGTLSEGLHLAPNIWPYTCPSRPWPGGQIRPKIRMTLPATSLMRLYPTLPHTPNILQYIHPSPPIPRRAGTCTKSRHPTLTNEDLHPAPPYINIRAWAPGLHLEFMTLHAPCTQLVRGANWEHLYNPIPQYQLLAIDLSIAPLARRANPSTYGTCLGSSASFGAHDLVRTLYEPCTRSKLGTPV